MDGRPLRFSARTEWAAVQQSYDLSWVLRRQADFLRISGIVMRRCVSLMPKNRCHFVGNPQAQTS
jgi:hypothetical protein